MRYIEIRFGSEATATCVLQQVIIEQDLEGNVTIAGNDGFYATIPSMAIAKQAANQDEDTIILRNGVEISVLKNLE